MNASSYKDLTPEEYIRQMFAETKNGQLEITRNCLVAGYEEYTSHHCLNWTAEDAENLVQKYSSLSSKLAHIGQLHDQLTDEESIRKLLSEDELDVYNTYVRPYEPMEINWDEVYPLPPCEHDELMRIISDIHYRGLEGDLFEEEELLLDKYWRWREEQSQKRIPFNRRSCADMIEQASFYERLISVSALEHVVNENGQRLAEEMALYYYGKEEPMIWE